jgi:hypothetical protein
VEIAGNGSYGFIKAGRFLTSICLQDAHRTMKLVIIANCYYYYLEFFLYDSVALWTLAAFSVS